MTQGPVCSQGCVRCLVSPKRSEIPTVKRPGLGLVIVTLFGVTVGTMYETVGQAGVY